MRKKGIGGWFKIVTRQRGNLGSVNLKFETGPILLVPCLVGVSGAPFYEGHWQSCGRRVAAGGRFGSRAAHGRSSIEGRWPCRTGAAVVELVVVLHDRLTLILYKVLDKSISADGKTKTDVTVNYKGRGGGQGTEVREEGIGIEQMRCAAACASAAEIPLTRILVWLKLRASPASSLNACLISERISRAMESFALMSHACLLGWFAEKVHGHGLHPAHGRRPHDRTCAGARPGAMKTRVPGTSSERSGP